MLMRIGIGTRRNSMFALEVPEEEDSVARGTLGQSFLQSSSLTPQCWERQLGMQRKGKVTCPVARFTPSVLLIRRVTDGAACSFCLSSLTSWPARVEHSSMVVAIFFKIHLPQASCVSLAEILPSLPLTLLLCCSVACETSLACLSLNLLLASTFSLEPFLGIYTPHVS